MPVLLPSIPPTASLETFRQLASWIQKCCSTHSCKNHPFYQQIPPATPSRLLELGPELRDVRLIDVDARVLPPPEYVALSYCWGSDVSKQLKTTKSNLLRHTFGINWELIPPVVQDAIATARCLSRFLWVDALCIVQDSAEDKSQEISKMGSIYAHSFVTIAANASAGVNEGFLSRESRGRPLRSSNDDFFAYNRGSSPFILRSKHDVTDHISPIEDSLWNKRGWTYQERLFSPRIIYYAHD